MRVRLTDQALVAVTLARSAAAARGGPASVADLLAGLATEPEGRAGRRLRERSSAAIELCQRAAGVPTPALDLALRASAATSGDRAVDTGALLDAAIQVGGSDVADLLAVAGYARDLDGYGQAQPFRSWDNAETFGFAGGDGSLSDAAARVVAQVRAAGGTAQELLLAIAAAPDAGGARLLPDADALAFTLDRAGDGDGPASGDGWSVDDALAAAHRLRGGERTTTADLVSAVLVGAPPGLLELVAQADAL